MAAHHAGDLLELFHHSVPAACVLLPDGVEVLRPHVVEGGGGHLIDGGHGQTGLTELERLAHELLVPGEDAPYPGPAGGKALGDSVDDHHVLRRIVEGGQGLEGAAVIDELPVGLVADNEEAVLLGDVHHHAHLLMGEDRAGRVAGVDADDGPGAPGDFRDDLLPAGVVIAVLGGGVDGVDDRAAGVDHGVVVGIVGLGDEDLVAVLQDAVEDDLDGLAAAGGDEDLVLVEVYIQAVVVLPDGVNEHGHPGRGGVLQHRRVEIAHRLEELGRGLDVRLTDVELIDRLPGGLGRHRVGMELPHGRLPGVFRFAGKFHSISPPLKQVRMFAPGGRRPVYTSILSGQRRDVKDSFSFPGGFKVRLFCRLRNKDLVIKTCLLTAGSYSRDFLF